MNEEVIKSFLVSIGYQTDEASFRKFKLSLESITKSVFAVGTAIAATGTAIVAGVKIVSGEMERLYYASQRTGETVGNIMALRYAATQVGISADQAQSSLDAFQRTLRLNPGANGLLSALGVTGDGPLAKWESFIDKTSKMEPYIGAQYASQFGTDPDTLLALQKGQKERLAAEEEYQKKLTRAGVNPDRAAVAGKNFDNSLRSLLSDLNIFAVLLQEHLAPVLTTIAEQFGKWADKHSDEVARKIADALEQVAKWVSEIDWDKTGRDVDDFIAKATQVAEVIDRIVGGVLKIGKWFGVDGTTEKGDPNNGGFIPDGSIVEQGDPNNGGFIPDGSIVDEKAANSGNSDTPPDANPNDSPFIAWVRRQRWAFQKWVGADDAGGNQSGRSSINTSALFARLEKSAGLPAGALDRLWEMESRRGDPKWMLSPAGAKGHFQFMDPTAEQYGVTNPYDLVQSATGAANYLHDLLAKYQGDIKKALAAYNWGGGNLDKDLAQHGDKWMDFLPKETANYLVNFDKSKLVAFDSARLGTAGAAAAPKSTPPVVHQKNTFNVHGSPDPNGTARSVAAEQSRVNADLVRNLTGVYV